MLSSVYFRFTSFDSICVCGVVQDLLINSLLCLLNYRIVKGGFYKASTYAIVFHDEMSIRGKNCS